MPINTPDATARDIPAAKYAGGGELVLIVIESLRFLLTFVYFRWRSPGQPFNRITFWANRKQGKKHSSELTTVEARIESRVGEGTATERESKDRVDFQCQGRKMRSGHLEGLQAKKGGGKRSR